MKLFILLSVLVILVCLSNQSMGDGVSESNLNIFNTNFDNIFFISFKVCQMAPRKGKCKAIIHRWYFDDSTKTCMTFIYGGCDGNENNFYTEKDCKETCKK